MLNKNIQINLFIRISITFLLLLISFSCVINTNTIPIKNKYEEANKDDDNYITIKVLSYNLSGIKPYIISFWRDNEASIYLSANIDNNSPSVENSEIFFKKIDFNKEDSLKESFDKDVYLLKQHPFNNKSNANTKLNLNLLIQDSEEFDINKILQQFNDRLQKENYIKNEIMKNEINEEVRKTISSLTDLSVYSKRNVDLSLSFNQLVKNRKENPKYDVLFVSTNELDSKNNAGFVLITLDDKITKNDASKFKINKNGKTYKINFNNKEYKKPYILLEVFLTPTKWTKAEYISKNENFKSLDDILDQQNTNDNDYSLNTKSDIYKDYSLLKNRLMRQRNELMRIFEDFQDKVLNSIDKNEDLSDKTILKLMNEFKKEYEQELINSKKDIEKTYKWWKFFYGDFKEKMIEKLFLNSEFLKVFRAENFDFKNGYDLDFKNNSVYSYKSKTIIHFIEQSIQKSDIKNNNALSNIDNEDWFSKIWLSILARNLDINGLLYFRAIEAQLFKGSVLTNYYTFKDMSKAKAFIKVLTKIIQITETFKIYHKLYELSSKQIETITKNSKGEELHKNLVKFFISYRILVFNIQPLEYADEHKINDDVFLDNFIFPLEYSIKGDYKSFLQWIYKSIDLLARNFNFSMNIWKKGTQDKQFKFKITKEQLDILKTIKWEKIDKKFVSEPFNIPFNLRGNSEEKDASWNREFVSYVSSPITRKQFKVFIDMGAYKIPYFWTRKGFNFIKDIPEYIAENIFKEKIIDSQRLTQKEKDLVLSNFELKYGEYRKKENIKSDLRDSIKRIFNRAGYDYTQEKIINDMFEKLSLEKQDDKAANQITYHEVYAYAKFLGVSLPTMNELDSYYLINKRNDGKFDADLEFWASVNVDARFNIGLNLKKEIKILKDKRNNSESYLSGALSTAAGKRDFEEHQEIVYRSRRPMLNIRLVVRLYADDDVEDIKAYLVNQWKTMYHIQIPMPKAIPMPDDPDV